MDGQYRIPIPAGLNSSEVPDKIGIPQLIEEEANDYLSKKQGLAEFLTKHETSSEQEDIKKPPAIAWAIEANAVILSGTHSDISELEFYLTWLGRRIDWPLDDWRKDLAYAEARTQEDRFIVLQDELRRLRERAKSDALPGDEYIDSNPMKVDPKGADCVQQWQWDEGPWTYEYALPATNISPDLMPLVTPWLRTFVGLSPSEVVHRLQSLWEPIRDPDVRLVADWLLQLVPRSLLIGERPYSALILEEPTSGNQLRPMGSSHRIVISLNPPDNMDLRKGTPTNLAEFFQIFGGLSIGFPPWCYTFGNQLSKEQAENYLPDGTSIPDEWREFMIFVGDGCGNLTIVNDSGNMGFLITRAVPSPSHLQGVLSPKPSVMYPSKR